jgi:hypothetical protein
MQGIQGEVSCVGSSPCCQTGFLLIKFSTISGTLFNANGEAGPEVARHIVNEVLEVLGDPRDYLGERLSWSMQTVAEKLTEANCDLLKPKLVPGATLADYMG